MAKNSYVATDFITDAFKVLKPPEKLTVSEWADKYRILDEKTSAMPGIWRTEQTPYLKAIMDSFTDPEVEESTLVKPTQVGGTESLNNCIGYVIAQDPSPTLVVYPTLELAEFTSDNRIKPMVRLSSALYDKFDEDSKRLELQFDGMYLVLSGANSPSSLASRPIRYLFLDEVDKYPSNAGKEADPISLARERTKTFANNKKIIKTSTPTLKTGPIWQEWINADSQYKYFVPCPHCGHKQIFKFKQLKYDKTKHPEEARNSAYYVCEECGKVITDMHKMQMIKNGEWQKVKDNGNRKVAFWINTFYSPWVKFGDIAAEFVKSKNNPELLMNFINSWLAEPWEDVENSTTAEKILERKSGYDSLVVPDGTVLITAGTDVQKKSLYFTIRAWQADMTNCNILHGQVFSFAEIENIMNQVFYDRKGNEYRVNLCIMDSGDQTDDVYDFCAYNTEWCIPGKGASKKMYTKYTISIIDKDGSSANGMKLILIDTAFYKDMIFARLKRSEGGFYISDDCDLDYAEQISSEHKVIEKNKVGKLIETWKPKKTNVDNHYLDAEVYCYCAAEICGIRRINADRQHENEDRHEEMQPNQNSWLENNNNWINSNGGSWLR